MRLVHGSTDGIPHVFVDQISESRGVWIGCNNHTVARHVLPAVLRAMRDEDRTEILVKVVHFGEEEDVSSSFEGLASSDAPPLGSSQLPFESHVTEFNKLIPRVTGKPLPFDLRARDVRKFLSQLCGGDSLVCLVQCDIATSVHCVSSDHHLLITHHQS